MLLYILLVLYIGFFLYLGRNKDGKYSTGILPLLLFSIVANVALSQNYTQSLIPEANDGIGISNSLAAFLISEEHWSHELFKTYYLNSTSISIVLIVVYMIFLALENIRSFDREK
jgi:hypothetical protein